MPPESENRHYHQCYRKYNLDNTRIVSCSVFIKYIFLLLKLEIILKDTKNKMINEFPFNTHTNKHVKLIEDTFTKTLYPFSLDCGSEKLIH